MLSEFSGSIRTLAAGALQVNPWHADEVAAAMLQVVHMSAYERKIRFDTVNHYIRAVLKSINEDSEIENEDPSLETMVIWGGGEQVSTLQDCGRCTCAQSCSRLSRRLCGSRWCCRRLKTVQVTSIVRCRGHGERDFSSSTTTRATATGACGYAVLCSL